MTDKTCPLLNKPCIKEKCLWYCCEKEKCIIKIICQYTRNLEIGENSGLFNANAF
jgi:hypothetical protein